MNIRNICSIMKYIAWKNLTRSRLQFPFYATRKHKKTIVPTFFLNGGESRQIPLEW